MVRLARGVGSEPDGLMMRQANCLVLLFNLVSHIAYPGNQESRFKDQESLLVEFLVFGDGGEDFAGDIVGGDGFGLSGEVGDKAVAEDG